MKNYRKELWFNIPRRRAFVGIAPQVEESLRESKIREGLARVNTVQMKFIKSYPAWREG